MYEKTIYVAFDETEFEDEEACLNYETKCAQRALHDYGIIFLNSTRHYIPDPSVGDADKIFYIGVPSTEAADALERYFEIHDNLCDCLFDAAYNAYRHDFYGETRVGWWRFNFNTMEWEKYSEEIEMLTEESQELETQYGF